MNTNSSALISAWDALPGEPAIAYYGEETMLRGTKVDMSEYKAFTEEEKLDALNNLIGSKHCLVIAPSDCNTFVPISQMDTQALILSAKTKARTETSAIIDAEILPVFEELVSLLKDPEPSVSAQALESIQDMIFDQTLRQLSKGHIKYFYFYLDDLMECLIMVLGNRKVLSFDSKKIKALQYKIQGLLDVAPVRAQPVHVEKLAKKPAKKPAKKAQVQSSSESSFESESETSSSSSSSSEEGLIPEGTVTPILHLKPAAPMMSDPPLTAAQIHAKDTLAAQKMLSRGLLLWLLLAYLFKFLLLTKSLVLL